MKTKLFFSSESKRNGTLQKFCLENGVVLTDQSLISFEKIPFELDQTFEVVFFSSPRSVEYFFSENYINSDCKIACVGRGTANALNAKNIIPDFIGENSSDPEMVGMEFVHWLGERKALFPVSKRSNNTIFSCVPLNQRIKIICYDTILTPQQIEPHDWYVFTSPSNVASFLLKNAIPPSAQTIAWGKTTAAYMRSQSIEPNFVLQESSEEALVALLSEK